MGRLSREYRSWREPSSGNSPLQESARIDPADDDRFRIASVFAPPCAVPPAGADRARRRYNPAMNSRERILAVLRGEIPDCVPVCPDISNMIPVRLTGKPFWQIYVYQDPPPWKAYIDAVKYFDIDGGFELYEFGDLFGDLGPAWERRIVQRRHDGSFVSQRYCAETGEWEKYIELHTADMPPTMQLKPETVGLPRIPAAWEPVEGVKEWPTGMELWKLMRREMGGHGVLGMPSGASTLVLEDEDDVYEFADHPEKMYAKRDCMLARAEARLKRIAELEEKPDFLFCGASGSLIWQSPKIFRELALPVLKRVTEMAAGMGIPTHVHSCGPEKLMVQWAAEETDLTVIDPLEIPPMGDCILADLKRDYGDRIVLKGNVHTMDVMLGGTPQDVIRASRRAIDDAAEGGRFILSTGDQTPRDAPEENIRAMVETARTYGRY
jgi:uroporphyrinogen decarboxylase